MASTKSENPRSGRTKMITVASIVAVGLASLFAIGANVGILTSSGDTKVGTVSAGDLLPGDTRVVDVYVDQSGNPIRSTTSTTSTTVVTASPSAQSQDRHDDDSGDDHGDDDHGYEGGDFDD